jgi:hypothetical protein
MSESMKERKLRAIVDFHKTWFAVTFAGGLASCIGFMTFLDNNIARMVFGLGTIALSLVTIITMFAYINRHEKLIKEIEMDDD